MFSSFQNIKVLLSAILSYLPDKGIFEDETKTAGSERAFKVSQDVIDLLKEQKAYQSAQRLKCGDKWQNSDRLFTSWNGTPLNPTYLTSKFRRFKQKHGIEGIRIHGLRHTNATLQIAAGTTLTTVAHRLGHANASTTTRIYPKFPAKLPHTNRANVRKIEIIKEYARLCS